MLFNLYKNSHILRHENELILNYANLLIFFAKTPSRENQCVNSISVCFLFNIHLYNELLTYLVLKKTCYVMVAREYIH